MVATVSVRSAPPVGHRAWNSRAVTDMGAYKARARAGPTTSVALPADSNGHPRLRLCVARCARPACFTG